MLRIQKTVAAALNFEPTFETLQIGFYFLPFALQG